MNREETIRLLKLSAKGGLTLNDMTKVLMEYCVVEHNKPIEDTNKLIDVLLRTKVFINTYVQEALEYYKRKFTICEVWSAPTSSLKSLFREQDRKVLLIF